MVLKNLILTLSSPEGFGTKISKICSESIDGESQIVININDISNEPDFVKELIESAERFIFIMPEFNASYPAAFKAFVDNSGWPSKLKDKSILLIGYSGGFSGNIIGLNHMRTILSYIKSDVYRDFASLTYNGKEEKIYEKEISILKELLSRWNVETNIKSNE